MNHDADMHAISAIRAGLEAAENAADADAAAALFADDVVVMVPDFPVTEGKDDCVGFLRDVMGWLSTHFVRRVDYVSAEVAVFGDMAFDRGAFAFTATPRAGGESTHVTGKYFWLLRRTVDAARWKVARLIVSRDEAGETEGAHGSANVDLVALIVEDYDPAIDFFVRVLGFDLIEDEPSTTTDGRPKRWVVVRPPGAATGLLLARADGDQQRGAVGQQFAGRVGLFLRVDDFDATHARMVDAGVTFVRPARTEPYGKVAVFLDIAGNRWDLLGPRLDGDAAI